MITLTLTVSLTESSSRPIDLCTNRIELEEIVQIKVKIFLRVGDRLGVNLCLHLHT